MKHYNIYYLPYCPREKINYIYLLYLYGIAESANSDNVKSNIYFSSHRDLQIQINEKYRINNVADNIISVQTIARLLKNNSYNSFFYVLDDDCIVLKNVFSKNTKKPFVRLIPDIYKLILQQQDNLFAKYIIFLIHCCGCSNNKADFTASQFFREFGYSNNSGNYKSMLSKYNRLLESERIITIQQIFDEQKHQRNIYSLLAEDYKK